jgi:predicted  nucleic acid-binding Zn-ribbon protein
MHAEIELALTLQRLDQRIAELEKEVAALPKQIAQIEKTLDAHLRRLEADQAALAANQRERRKLEGEIQLLQQKAAKFRDQMSLAKTNEQFRAFQHEIEFVEKEIRKAEDRILDLMGESEPLEAAVKQAEAALKEEKKQVEAEKASAQRRTAADRAEIAQLQEERREALAKLSGPGQAAYARLRKRWGAVIAAEVVDGRCTACQMTLRPQYFQELRRSEKMMFCEACGRIIYYNPPAGFEDKMDLPKPASA